MTIMDKSSVVAEILNNNIVEITIQRPESLNALNPDVLQGLTNEFAKIAREATARAVIITGAGPKAFVAGADIASMSELGPRAIADYIELGQRVMRTIESCDVPVIAAINGFALGGGLELALACDLIISNDIAKVGQPEVNLGIIPGFGGTQRLIHRCGVGVAKRLCFTGELLTAQEAFAAGIIDKVVPSGTLHEEARVLANVIASKAPLAIKGAKRVIRQSQEAVLLAGLRMEIEEFLSLFASADREEGMQAFLGKRQPRFTGR